VSETETETGTGGPTVAEVAERQDSLESKVDKILEVLGRGEGQAHTAAEQHTEDRLDRPGNIAEEIRAQIAAQQSAADADAEKRSNADRLAAVEQRITGMTEQTPEAPQRWIEKRMGWR